MGYYRVVSDAGDRRYIVENMSDGVQREMKIKYADIVRIKESDCQVIVGVSRPDYMPVSRDIHFVVSRDGASVSPVEEKMCALAETQTKKIKAGDIVSFTLTDYSSYLCRVESTSSAEKMLCVKTLDDQIEHKIFVQDVVLSSIKVLVDGYTLLCGEELVMRDSKGVYRRFETVASTVGYNSVIMPGQVMYIASKPFFTLTEVADELGVKLPEVKNHICNILPDNIDVGVGINSAVLDQRKEEYDLYKDEDVTISCSEFYRLAQYLNRPDTQFKSIIHWEFYVSKRFKGVPKPQFLMNCDPYRFGIPYQDLDMDKFLNLKEWLDNRGELNSDIVSYFPLFPLLYWSEQIRFIRRLISLHKTQRYRFSDLNLLEQLTEHPKHVNINVLIFIHTIIKLYQEHRTLYNNELYHIWRSTQPDHIDGLFGLALNDYIGTNLFCKCRITVGFNVEDWWQPNVFAGNKPVLYRYSDGTMELRANGNLEMEATMLSVKKHKGFVVFREDDNREASQCFSNGMCPVMRAINEDSEYRGELLKKMDITPKEFEENMHLMDLFAYDDCPLISVPSWRKKWAERHRDKCVANTPPRVESIYLWHKRKNYKAKHLFCEGKLSKVLHKKAQLPYSWCGNACFANIFVMPELTASYEDTKILSAGRVDVYSAAVYLNLLADEDELKLKFQNFHSCLNWLNIAAKRLYCKSCNHILEAVQTSSNYTAHTVSLFTCQNKDCGEYNKRVYLSHCWNEKCRGVIDSRETSLCPLHKYICPSCGVCCGDKMFEFKRQADIPHKSMQYHYEQSKFFCYKCGKEMSQQGSRYYCKEHPEVVTKAP